MDNIDKALAFEPPPHSEVHKTLRLREWYFQPVYRGMENIDLKRPTLFVGNHTRFGLLDAPLLCREIYLQSGVFIRSLADRSHLEIPLWRDYLAGNGAVLGSREMCRALMDAGQSIMVFPGGAREVVKGKGLDYTLLWRERLGFVRMAMEHGYSITPFSSVGAEEALSVVADSETIRNSLFGKLMKATGLEERTRGGEVLMPLPRGIGLSILPRPERFYFSIGKPIETRKYQGQQDDKALLQRLQTKTAKSINNMIKEDMLNRARAKHDESLIRRLLQRS
ncbi:MAG: lysophospholipid acyltransferase family protein [Pseudomonadales bacterium]